MKKKHTFNAVIENAGGGGAYIRIPFNVEEAYGNKRVKVKATFDGEPYRGLLVRMGEPYHLLILLKAIREKIGKDFGDEVKVTVEEDVEPRVVEVPADLQKELKKNKDARVFFDTLSYSHKREYVRWIQEAKREETRKDRILKAIEMLKTGRKER